MFQRNTRRTTSRELRLCRSPDTHTRNGDKIYVTLVFGLYKFAPSLRHWRHPRLGAKCGEAEGGNLYADRTAQPSSCLLKSETSSWGKSFCLILCAAAAFPAVTFVLTHGRNPRRADIEFLEITKKSGFWKNLKKNYFKFSIRSFLNESGVESA